MYQCDLTRLMRMGILVADGTVSRPPGVTDPGF